MKHIVLLLLMITGVLAGFGQNKSTFDLNFPEYVPAPNQSPQAAPTKGVTFDYETLENETTAFTLLSDGYFTIGTTSGLSAGTLDDHCQITFGHPFALTSYPFFTLDGVPHHPELYFYGTSKELTTQGDTLLGLHATDTETVDFTFTLTERNNGEVVRLHLAIRNIDDIPHTIGMGLLFDPALGLWGDGFAWINGQWIRTDTTLQSGIPTTFPLWERAESPKGTGVTVEYVGNLPSTLTFGNWFDLHYNLTPAVPAIYDLAIETKWAGVQVNPDEEVSFTVDIALQPPEFPNGVFMRADLPYFLSVENNLLFPREVTSLVKLANNSSTTYTNTGLEVSGEEYVKEWNSPDTIDLPSNNTVFTGAFLKMPENYENRTVEMELTLTDGAVVLDQLNRTLFVPAEPFSDSGLVVTIDSVIFSDFPTVDLIFHSQIEESGQYLRNLARENVFYYENQERIEDFTLVKDTTGGTNEADIIFVLDVTGSMTEEIGGVKDNIVEFCDSLSYQGIDFRLGMVTFLDDIENIYDFTADVQLFQSRVNQQYAHGGGDWPENSLEALMAACQFDFRPSANRVFIWITDATYHINNSYTPLTPLDVVNEMLTHAVVPHGIGDTDYELEWFYPILIPTNGQFYDIYGNFRDILLQISRLESTGYYRLSYMTSASQSDTLENILEVHYAGLGGMDTVTFVPAKKSYLSADLSAGRCFPNPFSSSSVIQIDNPQELEATVEIYAMQGQRVAYKHFPPGHPVLSFTWNGLDERDHAISNGLYVVSTTLYKPDGAAESLPVMKVIYLNK